jgi:MFS family permease
LRAHRRGLALAIDAASSNLGTVAVPLIGGISIATLGWRSALALFGLRGILIGALVDGYGFASAFAAMGASQVLAALVLLPAHLRRTVYAAPNHLSSGA